jgi:Mce-associated membrane protein
MTRPAPRRPSRTTTPKPRKIAGRDPGSAADPATPPPESAPAARPSLSLDKPPSGGAAKPPRPPRPTKPDAPEDGGSSHTPSALSSPVVTSMLLVLVGFFVLLLVLQGVWFAVHGNRNDDRADAADRAAADASADESDEEGKGSTPIAVPSGRPVVLNENAVLGGVDAAASAAQVMFARNWKTYDDGVDDAVSLMTDDFAKEYQATSDDVRAEFIRKKTDVQVRVVAQSVVRANDTELQALIFLNQYTIRGEGQDAKTTYTPYRALMTMVHTDTGWLVDGVDTK